MIKPRLVGWWTSGHTEKREKTGKAENLKVLRYLLNDYKLWEGKKQDLFILYLPIICHSSVTTQGFDEYSINDG